MVQFFSEAQVDEFGEALCVDHNVFRFKVAEDDVLGVQVADGIEYACYVEHGSGTIEAAVSSETCEEFSSLDVLEHHVDVFGVLEGGLAV